MAVWNLIETWDASPGFAMGLDEALRSSLQLGQSVEDCVHLVGKLR